MCVHCTAEHTSSCSHVHFVVSNASSETIWSKTTVHFCSVQFSSVQNVMFYFLLFSFYYNILFVSLCLFLSRSVAHCVCVESDSIDSAFNGAMVHSSNARASPSFFLSFFSIPFVWISLSHNVKSSDYLLVFSYIVAILCSLYWAYNRDLVIYSSMIVPRHLHATHEHFFRYSEYKNHTKYAQV